MKKFLSYKSRSVWKGYSQKGKINSVTFNRFYLIKKKDVGKEVYVYNGKNASKFNILYKHIGYKLGQFQYTKRLGMSNHLKNVKGDKKIKNIKKK